MARIAISPRLAMSTLRNTMPILSSMAYTPHVSGTVTSTVVGPRTGTTVGYQVSFGQPCRVYWTSSRTSWPGSTRAVYEPLSSLSTTDATSSVRAFTTDTEAVDGVPPNEPVIRPLTATPWLRAASERDTWPVRTRTGAEGWPAYAGWRYSSVHRYGPSPSTV